MLAQELEDRHLWYYTTFCVEEGEKNLHFEGIDTYADIFINGKLVRSADNMFLSYDVEGEIHPGNNEVVVHIWPTMLMARNYTPPAACNALKYNFSALYVRKASHMFGWDIMPRIISGGLWKQVTLCDKKRDRMHYQKLEKITAIQRMFLIRKEDWRDNISKNICLLPSRKRWRWTRSTHLNSQSLIYWSWMVCVMDF